MMHTGIRWCEKDRKKENNENVGRGGKEKENASEIEVCIRF